jgi:antitoxin (DNA-binding transcriptional repressor) of toxin-antitoxin stability system
MIRLNMHEAKMHLSRYLARLKQGEVIVLCKCNTPVAEIRALAPARRKPRTIGLAKGFKVPKRFFEALPEDIIGSYEGRT